jgi:hypothetical protein
LERRRMLGSAVRSRRREQALARHRGTKWWKSARLFREVHPALIADADLQSERKKQGFRRTYSAHSMVADRKKMLALGFWRN